ncbi:MAG TPA: hypothetical protein VFI73_01305 [Candidatus Nitrosopolaris sp.]|nr:hypothetical protein [Candidatus Nitrosopolaris sp.]
MSLLAVALIFSSTSEVLAKTRQAGPVTCRFGGNKDLLQQDHHPATDGSSIESLG